MRSPLPPPSRPVPQVMVWLPHGRDYLGSNFTNFKGSSGHSLSANDTTFNQNAAAYLRLAPAPPAAGPEDDGSGGGLSAGAIAGGLAGVLGVRCACCAPPCNDLCWLHIFQRSSSCTGMAGAAQLPC